VIRTKYLIINAETGDARTVTRRPTPEFGEVVYRLKINVPDRWNDILGDIEITLPEPPEGAVVTEVEPVD
jgi:hypothetical protein